LCEQQQQQSAMGGDAAWSGQAVQGRRQVNATTTTTTRQEFVTSGHESGSAAAVDAWTQSQQPATMEDRVGAVPLHGGAVQGEMMQKSSVTQQQSTMMSGMDQGTPGLLTVTTRILSPTSNTAQLSAAAGSVRYAVSLFACLTETIIITPTKQVYKFRSCVCVPSTTRAIPERFSVEETS